MWLGERGVPQKEKKPQKRGRSHSISQRKHGVAVTGEKKGYAAKSACEKSPNRKKKTGRWKKKGTHSSGCSFVPPEKNVRPSGRPSPGPLYNFVPKGPKEQQIVSKKATCQVNSISICAKGVWGQKFGDPSGKKKGGPLLGSAPKRLDVTTTGRKERTFVSKGCSK